ncbi:glycosyltransferase family 4 protein [Epilithonimonas sp. JDS]|uniref:glycosyltransferase family 4 protein n=1 Tax=Epilithonimonas sp. JDS TaxID=2902797 RepID=UPI001E5E94BC|nr:glycosyltransferase family 1 protein [Epilithonimonas sp. JDS]MCD9856095.1 glycosyltransferase family 4 protein [Epilithonimonas sp. JDS]
MSLFKISTRTLRKKKSDKLLRRIFEESSYDLFVPTYYNPYFLDKIKDKPFVLTVYDMIHELMPQYFENDPYNVAEFKALLITRATKIIAVSNNTKKDILKFYPQIDPNKIKVIYHGSSIKIEPNIKVNLPDNYILYVGSRANYKNFEFLVQAITPLLKANPKLNLLAAGGGEFDDDEVEWIKSLNIEKQIIQKNFEENELGYFYKNAKLFVFPSLYEGFGIPVLESMASGCPIILTKHGSFPEVAGEAGIYFDSNSIKDLQYKIQMLLDDSGLRAEFIKKGFEQVKKYNWKDAAEKCLKVYQEAMSQK